MKRILVGILLALALAIMPASAVLAADYDEVTVTATPAFLGIEISPDTWAPNGIVGDGVTPKGSIAPDTLYYANPLGDDEEPSDPVVDGECRFTIDNTSSVATNVTVNFPNHTGGDASTNSNLGTNDTTKFGAYSYCTGMTYSSGKVIAQASGSDPMKTNLGATTDLKFGLTYESQSNAWTSATPMVSTVTVTLSYYIAP